MRRTFAQELFGQAKQNKDIVLVTADLGYGIWDQFQQDLPKQFINTGAAEQAACGICVGLALSGKIPIFYSITSFLLYRPFETIRNYINYEKIPVILVGSGRNKDYLHDGISHWAEDDKEVLTLFENIHAYWPNTQEEIPQLLHTILEEREPSYINLSR